MREKLFSLHYVLKGLKTLSRASYEPPPPTDFVLIDYADSATFDPGAGYYHPTMKTADGRVVPSSDRLLHEFLRQRSWTVRASDELTLLKQKKAMEEELLIPPSDAAGIVELPTGNTLISITKLADDLTEQGLEIKMSWYIEEPREVFPWMSLRMISRDHQKPVIVSRGLCAPEATQGTYHESWHISPQQISEGTYEVEAFFIDNSKHAWATRTGQANEKEVFLAPPISLGRIRVVPGSVSNR